MVYVAVVAVLVFLAVAYAWYLSSQARVWVVRVRDGNLVLMKGKIAQTVVADLGEVLQRHSVRRGALYGINRRGRVTLGFSRSIPPSCRQSLRNVWSMHAR
ncbi:MAG TPA: DUF3634 family protein [Gemmataceae bacterium]|nr:DUF3634 family protein [Gemmataceae bacterium]